MEQPVIVGIVAASLVVAVGWTVHLLRKQRRFWRQAADLMDFELHTGTIIGGPRISGEHRGTAVKARGRIQAPDSDGRRPTYYFVEITAQLRASCWQQMKLTRRRLGTSKKAGKLFGKDESDGDSTAGEFEAQFRLHAEISDQARRCLRNPEVQEAIRELAWAYHDFSIEDGELSICSRKQRLSNPEAIHRRIDRIVDTAHLLDEAAESTVGTR